jgi:hypothetical protein
MRALISGVQVLAIVALVAGVAWFVRDYTKAKAENEELRAAQEASSAVIYTLGMQLKDSRLRATHFRQLHKELSNVADDNTCRSPAVDHVFELLRQRRAQN